MTTTGRTALSSAVPMAPLRRTAFLAGALYLTTFAASIPAVFLLDPVLSDPGYVLGPGADTQVLIGGLLDVVNALACIGTAVVLFPVVRRHNETLALGFVTSRLLEAAIICTGVVSLFAVVTLRQDVAGAPGVDDDALVPVGAALVAVRDWTFLLGPGVMATVNALLLGTLVYRSGLVPRAIPLLGLVGAPLLLSAQLGILFGVNDEVSLWSAIALAPIFVWELSLGLWLVLKGFTPCPITQPPPGTRALG
ncbi:DUF4386 domain-containing protein [Geodermatophilus sabuli]|uniref:DUF4386 domain-containing protein n=1 Tax=Geodermatophilus sabuli TaxID=1564158 RepID=A0A285EC14_9ACTN|nr:DUF4386 domain-containing protein [Geodermatophilus sabuli]MBB3084337.1 hypothetical protein [Geodermatophilus sabuli]SNX96393.1 protein of unknown function [Geodermatophilus sabuli]